MIKKIAIFGAGGFAREVLQIIHDINSADPRKIQYEPVGFIVDSTFLGDSLVHGLPILGTIDWLKTNTDVGVVIAIGSPGVRKKIASQIENETSNCIFPIIHPKAWIGRNVDIGHGSIICAGALITTDIKIGKHVHINIGCTIGHDAVLRDFVTLNPSVNVSGNVEIGEGVEIGTRSVLIPNANVEEWSVIGAGTVVTKPLPSNITAVGAPAKIVKRRNPGWEI